VVNHHAGRHPATVRHCGRIRRSLWFRREEPNGSQSYPGSSRVRRFRCHSIVTVGDNGPVPPRRSLRAGPPHLRGGIAVFEISSAWVEGSRCGPAAAVTPGARCSYWPPSGPLRSEDLLGATEIRLALAIVPITGMPFLPLARAPCMVRNGGEAR